MRLTSETAAPKMSAMPFYTFENCPQPVRQQLDALTQALENILGDQLVGVYLHGSLAFGCFNPQRSDLDLLVRIQKQMDVEQKSRLGHLLLELSGMPCPIEISFLSWQQLFPWRYPTPYDFHFSEDWRDDFTCALNSGEWQRWNDTEWKDPDLAAHIVVCSQRGIRLTGLDFADAFPTVPSADFRQSILQDVLSPDFGLLSDIRHPVYVLLNGCRTLAYLQDGHILSKAEGGGWAAANLPGEYQPIIQSSLQAYAGGSKETDIPPAEARQAASYLHDRICDFLAR